MRDHRFFVDLIIPKYMTEKKMLTRERRIEIALILKRAKDIEEWEIEQFTGVTRQTLNYRLRKGQRV